MLMEAITLLSCGVINVRLELGMELMRAYKRLVIHCRGCALNVKELVWLKHIWSRIIVPC